MAEILLLEDAAAFRRIITSVLRDEGHGVTHSPDGVIVYEQDLLGAVDLMITDIDMPRVNGIEAILTARNLCPDLKIIAMSGGGDDGPDDYLMACRTLGADHVLRKPFDTDALVDAIRSVLAPSLCAAACHDEC